MSKSTTKDYKKMIRKSNSSLLYGFLYCKFFCMTFLPFGEPLQQCILGNKNIFLGEPLNLFKDLFYIRQFSKKNWLCIFIQWFWQYKQKIYYIIQLEMPQLWLVTCKMHLFCIKLREIANYVYLKRNRANFKTFILFSIAECNTFL